MFDTKNPTTIALRIAQNINIISCQTERIITPNKKKNIVQKIGSEKEQHSEIFKQKICLIQKYQNTESLDLSTI